MITGLYISGYSNVTEKGLQHVQDGEVVDFAIVRARVGGKDDSKITQHRRLCDAS